MDKKKQLLLVDDDERLLFLLADQLTQRGFSVKTTVSPAEAFNIVNNCLIDAVLLDLVIPGADGIQILQTFKKQKPHLPVIILSGHGTIAKAVQAVKMGACDFLEKPVSFDKVVVTLENAMTRGVLEQEKHYLLSRMRENYKMVGKSSSMREINRLIHKIGPTDSPVLITGESGTGKELVARALHLESPRAAKPFIPINCAAIPDDLMEVELFGHEKGAFTGAVSSKCGLFQQADGGTLFLDEISEMSQRIQSKLLRVLETMEFQPVGSTHFKRVDVRLISATNKDLNHADANRSFRPDLFYRVSVLDIHVPPLRDRKEDIPLLIDFYADQICKSRKMPGVIFQDNTVEQLMAYHWPGNIRQLKNLVEKILVLADGTLITPETLQLLPDTPVRGKEYDMPSVAYGIDTLESARQQAEKELLERILRETAWDYDRTADILQISRATLFNKIKQYRIPGKNS